MRKISFDDVGNVMPRLYYTNPICDKVYTVMVIKTNNQALAVTFPLSNASANRPKDITGRQREAIRWFMKRNT